MPSALISVELCTSRAMHRKYKLWQKSTIKKFSVDLIMQFSAKDQIFGRRKTGSCIMTIFQHIHRNWSRLSWLNMELQTFTNLPTLHIWLLATCFRNLKRHWKDTVLKVEKKCRRRRRIWTLFQKKSSRGVFGSGRIGELCRHKETTSNGIRIPIPSRR